MQQGKKKITFSGSLARRAFLVCFLFLIAPLFIHTFFLYKQEIQTAEQDIRSGLKSIGRQMALRISDQIHFDWQILDVKYCSATLETTFHVEKIMQPGTPGDQFVALNERGDALRVGKVISNTEMKVISHPLKEFLTIKNPPFPIDSGINVLKQKDQWIEKIPIPDTKLFLVLGTSNERIYELQKNHLIFRVGTFLALVILFGGGLVLLLLRRLEKPLKALCLTMRRVADGAVHSRYVPRMWGFEINSIGRTFNETMDQMILHSQEAAAERIKREKMAQELRLGHEIQANLLPKEFPTIRDLEISAGCLPAKEVGGDFYDVFPLDSGKTLIVVADLAGKGISACLFSLGLRSSLRALAANMDSLSAIVKKANELFSNDAEKTSQFATLWIGILERRRLHFVSLGHPPALLKREGELRELSTQYPALGVMPFDAIQVQWVDLEPGDEILVFSDGATEAMDEEGKLYGMGRLKAAFLTSDKKAGVKDVLKEIQLFSQGAIQHDDLTLLYFRMVY